MRTDKYMDVGVVRTNLRSTHYVEKSTRMRKPSIKTILKVHNKCFKSGSDRKERRTYM